MAPFTAGQGVIFMLHRVTPDPVLEFEPNRILKISPDFLDGVLRQLRDDGFDFVSMDDVPGRLRSPRPERPFAAFTLDDGYRDNCEHAVPVFKRHGVPFTIYVPSHYGDGKGDLWWIVLEEALRRLTSVTLEMNGRRRTFDLASVPAKDRAFNEIYWWLRSLPEDTARAVTHRLARDAAYDASTLCRDLVMSWDELRELAKDPLVGIGAHTTAHYALSKLAPEMAEREIAESIAKVEKEIGRPCRHFSYPYGCEASAGEREFEMAAKLGATTAVTTRKGLLHASDAGRLNALPRFSLNGDFQDPRYIKVLLSGAPFAFWNALQRWSAPAQQSQA